MKCIAVYTNSFEQFSDILDEVLETPLNENEEKEVEGITVSESGEVPINYLERMRNRLDVVVMRMKDRDITILQHGDLFEILIPDRQFVVH